MFQSTHLREVRQFLALLVIKFELFQSTHLREVRRKYMRKDSVIPEGFNPRTYERCDDHIGYQPIYTKVSIHAPTRGATVLSLR